MSSVTGNAYSQSSWWCEETSFNIVSRLIFMMEYFIKPKLKSWYPLWVTFSPTTCLPWEVNSGASLLWTWRKSSSLDNARKRQTHAALATEWREQHVDMRSHLNWLTKIAQIPRAKTLVSLKYVIFLQQHFLCLLFSSCLLKDKAAVVLSFFMFY